MGEYFMWANPKKKEWIEADVFSEFGFMLGTASELVARGITAAPDGDIKLHGAVDVILELLGRALAVQGVPSPSRNCLGGTFGERLKERLGPLVALKA